MTNEIEKVFNNTDTNNDLEEVIIKAHRKQESRIEELERRVVYCELVAREYEMMCRQLQSQIKALGDRQGNIQQVYDYLTRVGSSIVIKEPHEKKFLNPISKTLPPTDKKYLELLKTFKFKAGDKVYYARENDNFVSHHLVNAVDIIDKHPRYCISEIFGYVDESKLFFTENQAQWQLDEWNRSRDVGRYC